MAVMTPMTFSTSKSGSDGYGYLVNATSHEPLTVGIQTKTYINANHTYVFYGVIDQGNLPCVASP